MRGPSAASIKEGSGKVKNQGIPLDELSLSVVWERVLRRDLRHAFANGAAVIARLECSRQTYRMQSARKLSYNKLFGHTRQPSSPFPSPGFQMRAPARLERRRWDARGARTSVNLTTSIAVGSSGVSVESLVFRLIRQLPYGRTLGGSIGRLDVDYACIGELLLFSLSSSRLSVQFPQSFWWHCGSTLDKDHIPDPSPH